MNGATGAAIAASAAGVGFELPDPSRQLRLIADHVPLLIAHCDARARYTFVNAAYAARFGLTPDALVGRTMADVVGETAYGRFADQVDAVLRGEPVEFELAIPQAAGDVHVVRCAYTPEREGGRVVGFVAVIANVTERRRVEDETREARARLESALAASEIGTWDLDLESQRLRGDPHVARILGLSSEAPGAGRRLDEYLALVHPDDRERVEGDLRAAIAWGDRLTVECRYRHPDGQRWIVSRGAVERDANGRAIRLRGATVDITAQRTAEDRERRVRDEAAAADAKFRAFFDQGALFAAILELDGTIAEPNRMAWEGCGFTREQVAGQRVWEGPWWAVGSGVSTQLREASLQARSGIAFRAELPYRVADGSERVVDLSLVPVKDEVGRVRFLALTGTDVTERKRVESAWRQKVDEMRTLLDTLPIGVFIAEDPDCITITGNAAAHELLRTGQSNLSKSAPSYAQPQNFRVCRHGVEIPPDQLPVQRAARGEHIRNEEVDDHFDDGTILHTLISAAPLYDEHGRPRGAIASVLDVTERKRAEESLREADRHKNEFIATLAHELRNPLAPLLNGLQLMRLAPNDAGIIGSARSMMERQLAQLIRLVDDLLDVSRISLGKLELRLAPVSLAQALQSAVETSRPLLDELGQTLDLVLPAEPIVIEADFTRLAQVFMNLLNNAAKYSERGGRIELSVTRGEGSVVVTVRDTGIGIAREQLPRIFDVFAQVDRSLERSRGGLGIGLSLVKRLVALHGGQIEAHSDGPGTGSTFVVTLPHHPAPVVAEASAGRTDERASAALRILVVDDNRDGADTMALLLDGMGFVTRTVYDGEEALRAVEPFGPHVILLDLGLPRVNGFEVCRQVRAMPGGARILIIAQTGWGQEDDRRRTREAGFDHHLVKPMDPAALIALLQAVPVP